MEILFISHKFPPTIGGMEKQSFELISRTSEQHKVHRLIHTGETESKLRFFLSLKRRIKKILRANPGIEIIHLNDGLMGLFTLWLKRYTPIPVVITFHGLDLVFPNRIYQWFIKKYTRYDAAICVSTATAEQAIQRGFKESQVFVVPNGVDHEIARYQSDRAKSIEAFQTKYGIDLRKKKILTMLGRPVQRKGFSWFLEKVVPLLDEDYQIIMIGPRKPSKPPSLPARMVPKYIRDQISLAKGGLNDEARIIELLKNPEIKAKVIETGKVPFNELLDLLSLAHLFIMPNIKMPGDAEGFGLVALEASLREAVVLASNLEGIPEAIQDSKNGFLLPSAEPGIWTHKIKSLFKNSQALKTHSQSFKTFTLNNYSWQKMVDGYLDVFSILLKRASN